MSHSAEGADAPAPSSTPRRRFNFEPRPIDPIIRMRRIRIARCINLICRTKCPVAVALRATGLDRDHNAREDVCSLLDLRGISRRRNGVRRVQFPETPSRVFEEFVPRQKSNALGRDEKATLAAMAAELREVADPLGDGDPDVPSPRIAQKPRPPIICASCGDAFEGKRTAKFCSGACRIKHWRAQQ